ncbi:MAG TPA: hypothetical protein DHV37_05915 [Erysipelotrichaceae bacterium]|nr:hypothetical protein [Erysipelotrichaceae bacterium]
MKLVPVDPNDFVRLKKTKNLELIDSFIASGHAMVRLDGADKEYKTADSCVAALNASIKRFSKSGLIKAAMINGEAYLINLTKISDGGDKDVESTES